MSLIVRLSRNTLLKLLCVAAGVAIIFGLMVFASNAHAALDTIQTVAGTKTRGFSGDGGPAKAAELNFAQAVALAPDGAIIVADTVNNRIREIAPDATITTIAGNGEHGFSGDGGLATDAKLSFPSGVAVEANGTIVFTDTNNNRIREISPDGIIKTIAGTGKSGFSGDGGPAISAELNHPIGIAIAANGAIVFADAGNNRIREFIPGKTIKTIAGTGEAGFSGDGGPAVSAKLDLPTGIAITASGAIVFTDTRNNRIREFIPGKTIKTIAGTGERGFSGDGRLATAAKLNFPHGIAIAKSGAIIFDDTYNDRIREISADGRIKTIAGTGERGFSGDGKLAIAAKLSVPTGVTVAPNDAIIVADSGNSRIRLLFSKNTQTVSVRDREENIIYNTHRDAFELLYKRLALQRQFLAGGLHLVSTLFAALLRSTEIDYPNHNWASINKLPAASIESITENVPLFNWLRASRNLLR